MRIIPLIMLSISWVYASFAEASALRVPGPHSERVHHTKIAATLDTEKHRVTADMTLRWKNTTDVTLTEIPFHLYLNAFSATDTVFMTESGGGQLRGDKRDGNKQDNFGFVMVTKLTDAEGGDLMPQWQMDRDVATLTLVEPLAPGEEVVLNFSFTSQLPKVFARSGHNGDSFNFVAQWYPKPGVYYNGRWVNHRYHAHSEFFSDFGTYDVSLTAPSEFVVGATGYLANKEESEGNTTHNFVAEDVHDFVWTADKNFGVAEQDWNGINIKLLYQKPLDEKSIQNQFDAAVASFEWFDKYVGLYPYSTMTLVQPPKNAGGAGGMEYPTLVTTITDLDYKPYMQAAALVTIHEIGHNYWQGIFASNEFEESWMDEGINSYTEGRIMAETLKRKNIAEYGHLAVEMPITHHMRTASTPTLDAVNTNSWSFINSGAYGTNSYSKPATILNTVERIWGVDKVDALLKAYYKAWAFKHPNTYDFLAIAKSIDAEMAAFLDDAINTTKNIDLKVTKVKSVKVKQGGYTFKETDEPEFVEPEKSEKYFNTVTLARFGELYPQSIDVLLTYKDGTTETREWVFTSSKAWETWRFESDEKLDEVFIDPEFKLLLDKNLSNNIKQRKRTKQGWRWLLSLFQTVHHSFNAIMPL